MKHLRFLIFLLAAGTSTSFGQVWAPIGAEWHYGTAFVFHSGIHYSKWKAVGDTMLNSYLYTRVENQGNHIDGDYKDHFFTREDDNIIWIYSDSMASFSKLFDFSKSTGDWWTTEIGNCPLTMTVMETRTDTILGQPYRSMKIEFEGPDTTRGTGTMWANRLTGGMDRPLPMYESLCNNVIVDNEVYTGLRCYEDTAVGFWKVNSNIDCEATAVGIEAEEGESKLILYPNPVHSVLHLSTDLTDHIAHIYNSFGQELACRKLNPHSLDVSNLPPGLYFISLISQENQREVLPFLKE